MPLFNLSSPANRLTLVKTTVFDDEKVLQAIIEGNLKTVFNCQFVATEFSTGAEHAGRIDTLALSEDGNPVVIEYKVVESSDLINQSLFYLSWLQDHRGDFVVATHKALGTKVEIDWSAIRVICIAPGYKKYDLHAVKTMGANIELWQYRLFENGAFYLEEIFRRSSEGLTAIPGNSGKNPVMVAAGKKAAETRRTGTYTVEQHLRGLDGNMSSLVGKIREFILGLDSSIEEAPKKFYVAYKLTQNFACIEAQKKKIRIFLKLEPTDVGQMPKNARDVRTTGHFGTGDFELTVKDPGQLAEAYRLIKLSFGKVGG